MCNGRATEYGYRVECRHVNAGMAFHNPVTLSDGILTAEWRNVTFQTGNNPAGVPVLVNRTSYLFFHDLLEHEAAMALAWTIIAQNPRRGIECRLVPYKLKTGFTLSRMEDPEMKTINAESLRRPTNAQV